MGRNIHPNSLLSWFCIALFFPPKAPFYLAWWAVLSPSVCSMSLLCLPTLCWRHSTPSDLENGRTAWSEPLLWAADTVPCYRLTEVLRKQTKTALCVCGHPLLTLSLIEVYFSFPPILLIAQQQNKPIHSHCLLTGRVYSGCVIYVFLICLVQDSGKQHLDMNVFFFCTRRVCFLQMSLCYLVYCCVKDMSDLKSYSKN